MLMAWVLRRLYLVSVELGLGWRGGRDVLVDAGHGGEGWSTSGSARLSAVRWSGGGSLSVSVTVGHVGRDGL